MKDIVGYILYFAGVALLLVNKFFMPQIGEKVLTGKLISGVAIVLLGIGLCIYHIIQMLAQKRKNAEVSDDKERIKSIIQIIIGIAVIFFSAQSVKGCITDMKQGPIEIVLNGTYVEEHYRHTTRRRVRVDRTIWYLYGVEGTSESKKIKVEDIFDEPTIERINQESPKIVVIQYPNTKGIVQFQIHFEEGMVLIPDKVIEIEVATATTENDNTENDSMEPSNIDASTQYVEIPLEEIGDLQEYGIVVGAEYEEVASGLMYGFLMSNKYAGASNEAEEQAAIKAIADEYGLAEDQICVVYSETMGRKELIVVYDSETLVVEDMFARELVINNAE